MGHLLLFRFLGSLIGILVTIALFILWIWAIIDILNNKSMEPVIKVLWIIVVIFTGPIGLILYVLIGRDKKLL